MTWDPNAECILVRRPRSILGMLLDIVRMRTERAKTATRGATITKITRVLSESGRDARVVTRGADGDEWSVALGSPGLPPARSHTPELR